jgi:lysophospholipase L1-like esterase
VQVLSKFLLFAMCVSLGLQGKVTRAADIRLGHIKAERILFLGNSITSCPPNNWGLSASKPAKGYAHLLASAIDAKTGGKLAMVSSNQPPVSGAQSMGDANILNIADLFERGYASYNTSKLQKQIDKKPDIVILQFGENIPMATYNANVFKKSLKQLIADLKQGGNPHIFISSYILGTNPGIDEIKQKICAEDPTHRVFVDLSSVCKDPSNMGDYAHPNDKGMALIANLIFVAIQTHATAEMGSN